MTTAAPTIESAASSTPVSGVAATADAAATLDAWFNPMERQSGPPPAILGEAASQWWRAVTGLEAPTSNATWHERLERA